VNLTGNFLLVRLNKIMQFEKGGGMVKKVLPASPTLFVQLLGIKSIGQFNKDDRTYTWQINGLDKRAVNYFRTVHGGVIMGLLDDACGVTIYNCYGVNSAVTNKAESAFFKPLRPISSITITCQILEETGNKIYLNSQLSSNNHLIAEMNAVWTRR